MKRTLLLALLGTFAAITLNQPAQAQGRHGYSVTPRETYHRAWQLVRDNFYNPKYNGVNWTALEHKYDAKIKTTKDAHECIKLMLSNLHDPYTRFLDPIDFQEENNAINSRFVGIGVNLQQVEDGLLVKRVLEGGPADQAGIAEGDEILSIQGLSAAGLTAPKAAELIRGDTGTSVDLTVKGKESRPNRTIAVERKEITIKSVNSKMLDGNIGYVQISTFLSNDAAFEFKAALKKLESADGLILDLRRNPGGLFINAVEVADMLLDNGAVVSTISRRGKHTDLSSGSPVTHQPLVVMIDEETASASEILAGALKDNKRATIVGMNSYGKGLVQEINNLPGGAAVHITVSRYLTPNGEDINKVGVRPDVQVAMHNEQFAVAVSCLKDAISKLKQPRTISSL